MNCEDNSKNNYRFDYADEEIGRRINLEFDVGDAAPWWEAHQEFLNFLSAVYGYDIHKELDRKYREIFKGDFI